MRSTNTATPAIRAIIRPIWSTSKNWSPHGKSATANAGKNACGIRPQEAVLNQSKAGEWRDCFGRTISAKQPQDPAQGRRVIHDAVEVPGMSLDARMVERRKCEWHDARSCSLQAL